jgi:AcrR family transcriptional regulator
MATKHQISEKQPTRLSIIDAARNHIYHKGYGATSYANIAQETNLKKGNIQYHFKSKDELLQAVIDQQITGIRQQLESWSLDCGTTYDCIERFITMVDDNADNLSQYGCPMGTLNSELGKDHREQQHQARSMFDLYLRWLEARFSAILPRETARARAEQLMVMAQGASLMAHIHADPEIVRRQATLMREWLAEVCAAS